MILVLQVLATAINATFMALLDAGAPMRSTFCAGTVACKVNSKLNQ